MVRRKWIVPFKEGQRFPEVRRALQENRPVSKKAVDELIKKHQAEIWRLEGGTAEKALARKRAENLCIEAGKTDPMYEIDRLWKIESPSEYKEAVNKILKREKLL